MSRKKIETAKVVEVRFPAPNGGHIRIEETTGKGGSVVVCDVPAGIPFDEWDEFFHPMVLDRDEYEAFDAAVRQFMGWRHGGGEK